jgi:Nucleotidyl transferase of unknown function (DUF2204)
MAPADFCQDFDDFIAEIDAAGVDYVVVGAHALAAHGYVRATGDLDIFVRPTPTNASRLMTALEHFGAPVAAHGVSARDFQEPGMVYQMGLPPNRIDLLTELSGVGFDECLEGALVGQLGANQVRFIGLQAQLRNKRATGRTKDAADAEVLEALAQAAR